MEAIEEARNLSELPLEELIGSLLTYEMKIAKQEEEGKKKSIALKAQEEKVIDETKINDITKRVQKLMMKDKFSGRTCNRMSDYKKEGPSKEESIKRENELNNQFATSVRSRVM